jgi:STE24 endopeptidase
MNPFLIALVAFYIFYVVTESVLNWLNVKYVNAHAHAVPKAFKSVISFERYEQSMAYTKTKTRLEIVRLYVEACLLLAFVFLGAFGALDEKLRDILRYDARWLPIVYVVAVGIIAYLLTLPFMIYGQFVLEQRFGFNKMTIGTFVADQVKGLIAMLAMAVPMLELLFWLVDKAGTNWWIWGFASFMAFQFLMAAIFPVVLMPLFYKFSPLPEGDLKEALARLIKRLDFKAAGVFSMDGSSRSAHSNAFFAGMGATRRIVLFDTLISSLNTREIVAVIAHEIGHNKHQHVRKKLLLSITTVFLAFWGLDACMRSPTFFNAFGVATPSAHVAFVLFGLFLGVITFVLTPASNAMSRRFEYEADAFSVKVTADAPAMASSLIALAKDNLSNLTPHPWYSFFHYSHPTTLERINALGPDAEPK